MTSVRCGIAACWTVAVLATALARPASADPSADRQSLDEWQTNRNTFDTFYSHMKVLDRHHMSEVMNLAVEKRFLVVHTPLNAISSEDSMRVPIEDVHGATVVTVSREDGASGTPELNRFTLSITDFPSPRISSTINLNFNAHPSELTISRTVQSSGAGFHQIIFTQHRGPQSVGLGAVQVAITISRGQNLAPEQLNLESADFGSFIQDHPEQTEQYIRPLLRDLGQEAVFAPDHMVAWQVFSDLWKPDPAVGRRVQELLPGLDADDYRARDEALSQLMQTGRDGAAVLIHLHRASLTPEQNARIDRALLPFSQIPSKEALRLGTDPRFLLDCLYSEDASLRRTAIDRLKTIIRPDLTFDVNASPAARSAAIDALRARLLPPRPQRAN